MLARHLVLVRHAAAAAATSGQSDFGRQLTEEGRRDAERMGALLKREGVEMDALLASAAPRAIDTAALLATAREPSLLVQTDASLYEASVRALSETVRRFDDTWLSPWLVGHNPGLSHFADWLLGEPTVLALPTCAVVWLELAPPRWDQVKAGSATLRGRWWP